MVFSALVETLLVHIRMEILESLCYAKTYPHIFQHLPSIRDHERFPDFVSELNDASFDALFVTETWRGERQELFLTTHGHALFLSGGEGCRGVGIVLSVGFFRELLQVSFHAYSPQSCALHFHFGGRKIEDCSWYFSTTWDTDDAVDETYEFLNLLLDACVRDGVIPILAGDFNACVGSPCLFGVGQAKGMHVVTCWRLGLCNMDFK